MDRETGKALHELSDTAYDRLEARPLCGFRLNFV